MRQERQEVHGSGDVRSVRVDLGPVHGVNELRTRKTTVDIRGGGCSGRRMRSPRSGFSGV
jgi:hypothetical protein